MIYLYHGFFQLIFSIYSTVGGRRPRVLSGAGVGGGGGRRHDLQNRAHHRHDDRPPAGRRLGRQVPHATHRLQAVLSGARGRFR